MFNTVLRQAVAAPRAAVALPLSGMEINRPSLLNLRRRLSRLSPPRPERLNPLKSWPAIPRLILFPSSPLQS
jgi:hypothetical protein